MAVALFKPRLLNADTPIETCVKEGDVVQVYNGKNTIWTCIVDVKTRGYFDGVVSSRLPLKENSYAFGDMIRFHRRHIYNILETV